MFSVLHVFHGTFRVCVTIEHSNFTDSAQLHYWIHNIYNKTLCFQFVSLVEDPPLKWENMRLLRLATLTTTLCIVITRNIFDFPRQGRMGARQWSVKRKNKARERGAIKEMIEGEGMYESIWVSMLGEEEESRHKQAKEESFITLGGHFRW